MYYPLQSGSFFAGVRPFQTLRERVDNPLDLSVKQTVSGPEGSCPAEHEDLQLLIERKLAVTGSGLSSQPLTQQMPLLDNMFSYKPFGPESMSCQLRGTSSLNISQPFCTTTSTGHPISHLGLIPDLLHQSPNPLMEAAPPSLSSYTINGSGLPYHMRIGNAATAAAVMANQRAYFGHNSVLTPHMSAPFSASIPHISLYNDLMNDMTRRPVEPETSVFGTLSSLRAPDPSTRFSDHLQRLREHHIQQNIQQNIQQTKCSAPCCLPSLSVNTNHGSSGCNCCDVGLTMQSNVSTLLLSSPHSAPVPVPVSVSMPCNDVCNRDKTSNHLIHSLSDKTSSSTTNNNMKNSSTDNSVLINSQSLKQRNFEFNSHSCTERQSSQKSERDSMSCVIPNPHLWNPSHSNKNVVKPNDYHNKHSDNLCPNTENRHKESFSPNKNVLPKKERKYSHNYNHEVITLDEKSNESQTENFCQKDNSLEKSGNVSQNESDFSEKQNKSITHTTIPLRSESINSCIDNIVSNESIAENISKPLSKSIEERVEDNHIRSEKLEDFSNIRLPESQVKSELSQYKGSEQKTSLFTQNQEINKKDSNFKNYENTVQTIEPQLTTSCAHSLTKQLKDYKPVVKHINMSTSADKNKRQSKETKTVEVQCDGPDWTPIVLPQLLKNKLQKVIRKKLFGSKCKFNSIKVFEHKKDSKRRKKCKQKHSHQSRSSSVSTISSRKSSPERESDSNQSNIGRSKRRSMLQCLVNSEGYVADQIKKAELQPNLIASDPSQLGREERALQRAIKHIEDLNKPYVRDNCEKTDAEAIQAIQALNIIQNDNPIDENKSNDRNDSIKEINIMKKLSESYEKSIESVVYESRLQNQCFSESNISKKNKKLKNSVESKTNENNERTDPLIKGKSKTKRKLKELVEDHQQINEMVTKKTKKKKCEQNKCENQTIKLDKRVAQTNGVKLKKGIVSVRRRRFRSGLDMIRNGQRRKKPRNHQIQGLNERQEPNPSKEEITQKLNYESINGSVPTEMKRLMVNKALGETLLHRAARSNRLDVVNVCLQSSTCDVNARDNANYSPLHECCTRGHLRIARILLENGADVNASAAGGIRPIHDAIENNHIEVVRLLLSYGADPNISTYSGSTAIQLSRSKSMLKFLKGFLSDTSSESQTECVLSWKFNGSSKTFEANKTGFNVFDDLPSDDSEEESREIMFEISDTPMDPTYRLPNLHSKGSEHFMRLSDVLVKTRLTKEEFIKKHSDIEIVCLHKNELEMATVGQILTKSNAFLDNSEDIVVLDDRLRNIIEIDILRLI